MGKPNSTILEFQYSSTGQGGAGKVELDPNTIEGRKKLVEIYNRLGNEYLSIRSYKDVDVAELERLDTLNKTLLKLFSNRMIQGKFAKYNTKSLKDINGLFLYMNSKEKEGSEFFSAFTNLAYLLNDTATEIKDDHT
ncbi:MAG: hypothetical protein MI974_20310 [Chitinophagales bacterium]|nr:hypothetical protein [Chitinophagales bacterium]